MPQMEMTLGETIRAIRQRQEMTLRELGDICDISHAMLALYEKDKVSPPVDKLQRICSALHIQIETLIDKEINL